MLMLDRYRQRQEEEAQARNNQMLPDLQGLADQYYAYSPDWTMADLFSQLGGPLSQPQPATPRGRRGRMRGLRGGHRNPWAEELGPSNRGMSPEESARRMKGARWDDDNGFRALQQMIYEDVTGSKWNLPW